MKLQGRLLIFIIATLGLQSCLDSSSNRKGYISSSTNQIEAQDGVHILSACACKNGNVIDGPSSCEIQCAQSIENSDNVLTYLSLSIGKDVINEFYKQNPKTFLIDKPLSSICDTPNYKCQLILKDSFINDHNELEEDQERSPIKVFTSKLGAGNFISSDSPSKSVIKLTGISKPNIEMRTTKIVFQVTLDNALIHESENSVVINHFKGDGILETTDQLFSYTCLMAHEIAGSTFITTLETYNYYPKATPQYIYKNPAPGMPLEAWPFLCHTKPNYDIQWDFSKGYPYLPVVEVLGQPLPRLNTTNSGISFWGNNENDEKDFSFSLDGAYALTYDIDRRVYVDYVQNEKNVEEWQPFPLFSLFQSSLRPQESTEILGPNGRRIIVQEIKKFGYYMQPQPAGVSNSRHKFICPTKADLEESDDGRFASIRKVLSNATGRLKYETKPFFAACAEGIILGTQPNGMPLRSHRRIVYVSYNDLKKMGFSDEVINKNVSSTNLESSIRFSMQDLYKAKLTPFNDMMTSRRPEYTDDLSFKLVRRSVVVDRQKGLIPNDNSSCHDSVSDVKDGFIFGCYPVLIP